MTATPTPGDLSARLQQTVRDLNEHRQTHVVWRDWLQKDPTNEQVNPHAGSAEFHAGVILDYDRHLANINEAIAALSALPAAGGEESSRTLFGCAYQLAGYHDAPEVWLDRLSDAMQGRPLPDSDTLIDQLLPYAPDTPEKWDGHTHVASEDDGDTCEVCGRNFRAHATTPQPSAAEEVEWDGATRTMQEHLYLMTGERDRYKALHEQAAPTIARMERRIAEMDAAVGAQGDGTRTIVSCQCHTDEQRRLCLYKSGCVLIETHAAPAAGKGVDGVSLADIHLAAQMLTWGRDEGLTEKQEAEVDAHAQKLFAALTRQPVAGDGISELRKVAKRNLRSLIVNGSDDKELMLKCLEELS